MYNVKFNSVSVYTSGTDIEAIQYALAIHQSSNVPHEVKVYLDPQDETIVPEDWKVILTLIKS